VGHTPPYMDRFEAFDAERRRMRTVDDWIALRRQWLDDSAWPRRSPEQLAAMRRGRKQSFRLGGRSWMRTTHVFDLTPEARYELFVTYREFADPIRFPHLATLPKVTGSRWTQQCPACEIVTREIGSMTCPQCARRLVYEYVED